MTRRQNVTYIIHWLFATGGWPGLLWLKTTPFAKVINLGRNGEPTEAVGSQFTLNSTLFPMIKGREQHILYCRLQLFDLYVRKYIRCIQGPDSPENTQLCEISYTVCKDLKL